MRGLLRVILIVILSVVLLCLCGHVLGHILPTLLTIGAIVLLGWLLLRLIRKGRGEPPAPATAREESPYVSPARGKLDGIEKRIEALETILDKR
jgi:hypothetical protein